LMVFAGFPHRNRKATRLCSRSSQTRSTADRARNAVSRYQLIAMLLGHSVGFMSIVASLTRRVITIVRTKGTTFEAGDVFVFGFAHTLLVKLPGSGEQFYPHRERHKSVSVIK